MALIRNLKFTPKLLIGLGITLLLLIVLSPLRALVTVVLVLFAGVLLGVFLYSAARLVERSLSIQYGYAATIILLLLVTVLGLSVWLAGPVLYNQINEVSADIPEGIEQIKRTLNQYEWGQLVVKHAPDTKEIIEENSRPGGIISFGELFGGAVQLIINTFVVLFIGIYLMYDPLSYRSNFVRLFPEDRRERIAQVMQSLGRALGWWLIGRVTSMIVTGVLIYLALLILGVPYALMLALIATVLSFVPYVGPIVSAVPGIFAALTVSPVMAAYAALVYLAMHSLEGYVITPMIQRQAVSIPPALLISMQLIMGALFGIPGVFLATPVLVVVIVLVQMLYVEDVLGEQIRVIGEHTD